LQDLKTLTRGLAAPSHRLSAAAAEWKRDLNHRLELAGCELVWEMRADQDVDLSMVQWSALTRILRELVSNAISHAQARQLRVSLTLGGALLMMAAGVAWGVYSLRGKGAGDPTRVTAGNFLRAVPLALGLSLLMLALGDTRVDAAGVWLAVWSGAGASAIGYAIWYTALPALKATSAASHTPAASTLVSPSASISRLRPSASGTARRKLPAVTLVGSPAPLPRSEYTPQATPAAIISRAPPSVRLTRS
jgi:hypothetical protein